jgi:hypothetical protein
MLGTDEVPKAKRATVDTAAAVLMRVFMFPFLSHTKCPINGWRRSEVP